MLIQSSEKKRKYELRRKKACLQFEISDLRSRGTVLCSKNKDADQLPGYHAAHLRLCFRICKKQVFS